MKLQEQVDAGTRELRRYVEGNGFTWCEDESTVFNVTTAIGLMGGALDAQHAAYRNLEAERDALNAELIAKQETIDHLETELDKARNQAAICAATADSYLEDLKDVAYRLSVSYNGGGTVNIMRAIARLQNR